MIRNNVRSWHPPGAARMPSVLAKLEQIIGIWMQKWFHIAVDITLTSMRDIDAAKASRAFAHRAEHRGASLEASEFGVDCFLKAALGLKDMPAGLSAEDEQILQDFLAVITEDLLKSLPFSSEDAAVNAAKFVVSGNDNKFLCSINLEAANIDALLNIALPPSRLPNVLLQNRAEAVAKVSMGIEMRVGSTAITMSALDKLEAGDVLVLDRPTSQGLQLAIAGQRKSFAEVDVNHHDGRYGLKIKRAIG